MDITTISRATARITDHALRAKRAPARACRLATALTVMAVATSAAQAATFQVTSLADSGPGSLRAAIAAANSSGGVADSIGFAVSGTITLASRLPDIGDDLTIDGSGKDVTISGNNAVQVLFVRAGKTLELRALRIADGFCASPCSGGGVVNAGTLNVFDTAFVGNAALLGGAIHNFGTLRVSGSRFVANSARFGGAIHNFDTLSVSSTQFIDNAAARAGGAIYNFDALSVDGSVFSGNSAVVAGGDIADAAGTSTATVARDTLSTAVVAGR